MKTIFLLAGVIAAAQDVTVPFVPCKADPPPASGPIEVEVMARNAAQLAYYKSGATIGVLAPRGWKCLGFKDASGEGLLVTPGPIDPAKKFDGPVVEVRRRPAKSADMVHVITRVFPSVLNKAPASPSTRFGSDEVIYSSGESAEYGTPAGKEGLGTSFSLKANDSDIRGVAKLHGKTPDLYFLSVRLPDQISRVAASILRQFERDVDDVKP